MDCEKLADSAKWNFKFLPWTVKWWLWFLHTIHGILASYVAIFSESLPYPCLSVLSNIFPAYPPTSNPVSNILFYYLNANSFSTFYHLYEDNPQFSHLHPTGRQVLIAHVSLISDNMFPENSSQVFQLLFRTESHSSMAPTVFSKPKNIQPLASASILSDILLLSFFCLLYQKSTDEKSVGLR